MKRTILLGLILSVSLSSGVAAQRKKDLPPPSFWQGCVTVSNGTEWETAYVTVFDYTTAVPAGSAVVICSNPKR